MAEKITHTIQKENTIIIPVPLHPMRERWRGFNQATLLAELFASHLRINTHDNLITRKKTKYNQADIQEKSVRLANIANVFICKNNNMIKDKIILLVDDVATTGGTLDACAKTLKNAGAKKIIALTLAHG
jgi:ComF family protein